MSQVSGFAVLALLKSIKSDLFEEDNGSFTESQLLGAQASLLTELALCSALNNHEVYGVSIVIHNNSVP